MFNPSCGLYLPPQEGLMLWKIGLAKRNAPIQDEAERSMTSVLPKTPE
jgi:hypothetical protein